MRITDWIKQKYWKLTGKTITWVYLPTGELRKTQEYLKPYVILDMNGQPVLCYDKGQVNVSPPVVGEIGIWRPIVNTSRPIELDQWFKNLDIEQPKVVPKPTKAERMADVRKTIIRSIEEVKGKVVNI